jgi:hypothetical protein
MANVQLSSLLPSGTFLLSYSLLLFLPSLVLTFAGAFLTFDRTRSFVPINDPFAIPNKSRQNFLTPFFRGGVGGIIAGYTFGREHPVIYVLFCDFDLCLNSSLVYFPFTPYPQS